MGYEQIARGTSVAAVRCLIVNLKTKYFPFWQGLSLEIITIFEVFTADLCNGFFPIDPTW
jgi:hypothetical protein